MSRAPEPVPVTLVTGFLGAGKTTFVNRVLRERQAERIAVVVNEFGEVGIDGRLVVASDEEVVELANGCVCCTVRGDLIATLGRLLERRRRGRRGGAFERILIETSGLASPGPILQTLRVEPGLARATRAAAVITLVHAGRIGAELARHPEVEEQIGYASVLLVNHCDGVSEEWLAALEGELGARNPLALRQRTARAVDAPGAAHALALAALLEGPGEGVDLALRMAAMAPGAGAHRHTEGAQALVLQSSAPLELERLKMWLAFVVQRRTSEIWRIKGVLACRGIEHAVVAQAVYQVLELGPGEGPAPSESVLVVIGRGLERGELERGWRVCRADAPAG